MKLVLTAPDGTNSITVPAGDRSTTLRLASDSGAVPGGIVISDGTARITVLRTEEVDDAFLVEVPFSGPTATYRATLPRDPDAASDEVTAEASADASSVAEVAIGQYDWPFSLIAGVLLALLAAGILFIAGGAIAAILAPTTSVVDGTATTTPSAEPLEERLRAAVTIGLFAVGSIVVLLGGMMALLETRGRLRHRKALLELVAELREQESRRNLMQNDDFAAATTTAPLPIDKVLDAGSKALDTTFGAAKGVRGTVLTFVVGLVLLLAALLGSTTIDFTIDVGGSSPTESPAPVEVPAPAP